ncbi:MAG: hypothetical protein Tsb0020_22640 [Haliangiales bacterium]
MRDVWIIFRKDLIEVLRDRRTLVFMLALPLVVIPLLLEGAAYFTLEAERKAASETLQYALFEGDAEGASVPGLAQALADNDGFERVTFTDRAGVTDAVAGGELDFALVVEDVVGAADDQAGVQYRLALYYDNASSSDKARERASALIATLSERIRATRLEALGVADSGGQQRLLEPIQVTARGAAEMRAFLGEIIGRILPYFFIIFCYLGALYPAVDLAAGEKERGTLETLLLVPVERHRIVLGKFLVVFVAGATAAILSLLSLGLWVGYRASTLVGDLSLVGPVLRSIGALDLILIATMLVPAAAMFAALLLSISIYARSFKEAQSYAVPLNLLIVMPAVIAMMPGIELTWGWAMVPITNLSLAIKELVKGTMDYTMLAAILGSSFVLAGLMLTFCTWWFRREQVLFRA